MPFRTALSGLNAASTELRVIGNNIANASTVGFKESRAEFADVFARSNLGVSSNAVGSGVRVTSVSQQFGQGNVNFTDSNLDLAISGQGFFLLNDGGVTNYTRAGQFSSDRNGFIVNSSGQRLTVFQADAAGNITGAQGDLQLNTSDIAPAATTSVAVDLNLDAAAVVPAIGPFDATDARTYNSSTSLTTFDSLGSSHLLTLFYVKTGPSAWDSYSFSDGVQVDGPDALTFDTGGQLATPVPPSTVTIPPFNPGGGAANLAIDVGYGNTTQYGSGFAVNSLSQDGFTTGRLNSIDISDEGIITSRFTNGQSQAIGQVALANFANPQGLRQLGDTTWAESFDSGAALISSPGTGSLGLIESGALEGSNIDLTEQLVSIITAQRNFQANAQVITTADSITQTIINIR